MAGMERGYMVRRPHQRSIRYKFLKEIFLILFVSTLVLSTVIAINEGKTLRRSLVTKGQSFGSYIAMLSQEPLIMKDSIQLDSIVSEANKDEDIMYIVIHDAQGALVTSQYASINYRSSRLKVILARLSKTSEVEEIIAAIRDKEAITELSIPIITGAYPIGTVTICMSQYNIRQQILKTVLFVLIVNVMVTIVLAAVVFIVSRQIIFNPITELALAIARLAKGDLSTRIVVKATGEVQMLLEGFNQMAEDLDKTTVSKDYVDNIIKSMINSLIVVSPENKIIRTNTATCMLLGYGEKELVGRPVETIFGGRGSGRDLWRKTMLTDHHVSNIEETYLRKDGQEIPILFSASVMYDANEVLRGIVYVAQDITERKRAEEKLQKLAAVVRYSSELVILAALDGRMVFLNEAGAKMVGISPAEVEHIHLMQVIPDHLKEKVQNELLPALMNNGTWEGDLQYLNLKTGQLTDVHSMSFMIKDAVTGEPLFLANV
jgi:PAS domain S-box-containing protein